MNWKRIKLPRLPLARIPWQRPSRPTVKKMVLAGLLLAALAGAFYLGWQGALGAAHAQQGSSPPLSSMIRPGDGGDYTRQVVAYVYGNVPITRQELGEYLIDRVGPDRIDFLVNRRIIEMACRTNKFEVTDAEIQAQLAEDLKGFQCDEKQFVNDILRPRNKTLFEWKEDVIRPKLALQRLVQDRINVGEEDIQKGFEAKFGEKIECRIIVLSKDQAGKKYDTWTQVKSSPAEFDKVASSQFLQPLAAEGGKIPPIHHHFGDPNVEKEAFKLSKGEISPLIGMPDGTTIILRCENRIPPDTTRRLDQERFALMREIGDMRLAAEIPKVFEQLRAQANPQIFLRREWPAPGPIRQTARGPGPMQMSQVPQGMQPPQSPPQPRAPASSSDPLPPAPPVH
jgi:hypothetical protein